MNRLLRLVLVNFLSSGQLRYNLFSSEPRQLLLESDQATRHNLRPHPPSPPLTSPPQILPSSSIKFQKVRLNFGPPVGLSWAMDSRWKSSFGRSRTPMGTVPISVIYGYKYPLRESEGNFVKLSNFLGSNWNFCLNIWCLGSKFHLQLPVLSRTRRARWARAASPPPAGPSGPPAWTATNLRRLWGHRDGSLVLL